ncbi:MAG: hypothetical protein K1X94_23430, partial [Sandaracinaceae bacterium]|nr:hypothetical protein [Sandaracinaceae bacterium]
MSTSVAQTSPLPGRGRARWGLAASIVGLLGASAAAQEGPAGTDQTPVGIMVGGMAAYVDGLVADTAEWRGQRVPWPTRADRPELGLAASSWEQPLAIHGTLDERRASLWIAGLEQAFEILSEEGWPLPPSDGGRGGTDGFDVYVLEGPVTMMHDDGLDDPGASSRRDRRSAIRLDAALFDAVQDAAIVHALVSDDVPDDRIEACALQLVASAGLFASDPGEAESVREATATWLAWNETGFFGCDEDALLRQQSASFRAFVTNDARDGEGGALFVGAMAARHDGRETGFMRDVWLMARQHTRDGGELQGEPDVLRMLGQAATLARLPIDRVLESLAVARYF